MSQDDEVEPEDRQEHSRKLKGVVGGSGKSWHLALVSLGSFFLLSAGIILGVDAVVSQLTHWLAYQLIGYDEVTSTSIALTVRVLGTIIFVMTLWIGFLGRPLYEKRIGAMFLKLLKSGAVLLLFMTISVGVSVIAAFCFFLWSPRRLTSWDDRRMSRYHAAVIGLLTFWLVSESLLTEGVIGVDLTPQLFLSPAVNTLTNLGIGWLALSAVIFVFPLYVMLPKAIKMAWNMRRGVEVFWTQFVTDRLGLFGFILITAVILLAVLAPWIAPYHWSYFTTDQSQWYLPPSIAHPFGTDHEGGDILSDVIWGTQVSLLVGFSASLVAVVIGTLVGLISGYRGGVLDSVLMRITDVFLCLPTLPLMLIFLLLFGQGLQNVIIVIAILSWTGTARMVRSEALSLRQRPLTEAAHAIGASDSYILFKHIMPNTMPLILANVIIGVVNAILSEAGISFLGFMPIHGQPSWGIVLYWASRKAALVNEMWWWVLPPGLMIMLTAVGFAFVSHAADKVVNPRLRTRG